MDFRKENTQQTIKQIDGGKKTDGDKGVEKEDCVRSEITENWWFYAFYSFNCIWVSVRTSEFGDDGRVLHFVCFFLFVCLLKVCR